MENQPTLPVELIYKIFCCLDPQDVVRMRTVSKQFREISYDRAVWKALYACTRLPRPPGPFLSQSVRFLERTLVKSTQLARSWTTQPMQYNSSMRVPGLMPLDSKIVDGNWYISCESSGKKFVVHDLDPQSGLCAQQVLLEQDVSIRGWNACSVTSSEGLIFYILINVIADDNLSLSWKLLEFRTANDSPHLYHSLSLDIPIKKFDAPLELFGGHTPFLYIAGQQLIFDSTTQQLYEFPLAAQALDNIPSDPDLQLLSLSPLLTNTHIITFHRVYRSSTVTIESTLVQAFTLPTASCFDDSGISALCLSHEGLIRGDHCMGQVIRNSAIDPMNGDVNIRVLAESFVDNNLHLSCVDLTLPKHTDANMTTVLPMTVNMHDVFEIGTRDPIYNPKSLWLPHVESSDDGYVRGFWQVRLRQDDPAAETSVVRFSIDASSERCTGVLGKPLPSKWYKVDDAKYWGKASFDLVRGKLLCSRMKEGLAVLVDFE